jgi:hypothetical protein
MMEISVEVIEEAGYDSAMYGLSLHRKQAVHSMPKVAAKLYDKDGGHNKFLEQIMVWLDVRAPRYWWQEADTYRLSSKSSESTIHGLRLESPFRLSDFECEQVSDEVLNKLNRLVIKDADMHEIKRFIPEGLMQRRMWMLSYKTLRNIIQQRRGHVIPHWDVFINKVLAGVQHPELLGG